VGETSTEIHNSKNNTSTLEEYLQTLIASGKYNYQYTDEEKEKGFFYINEIPFNIPKWWDKCYKIHLIKIPKLPILKKNFSKNHYQ